MRRVSQERQEPLWTFPCRAWFDEGSGNTLKRTLIPSVTPPPRSISPLPPQRLIQDPPPRSISPLPRVLECLPVSSSS